MIPWIPADPTTSRLRNDRSSQELRAYFRDEYGADAPWTLARSRSRSVPLRVRFRRWLIAWKGRRDSPSSKPIPEASPVVRSDWLAAADSCPHLITEDLGVGDDAEFLRCTACGDVLVVGGSRQWRITRLSEEVASSPVDRPSEAPASAGPEGLKEW